MTALIALLKEHRKAIGTALAGALAWGNLVVASEPAAVTASEWLMLASVILSAFGVVAAQNQTPGGTR